MVQLEMKSAMARLLLPKSKMKSAIESARLLLQMVRDRDKNRRNKSWQGHCCCHTPYHYWIGMQYYY